MLALFFEGKAKAFKELRRRDAWSAWHAGVFAQSTKIPSLSNFLDSLGVGADEPPAGRRQTPDEQWAIALAWTKHLNGQVLYRETE